MSLRKNTEPTEGFQANPNKKFYTKATAYKEERSRGRYNYE